MNGKKLKFGSQQIIPLICLIVSVVFFIMGIGKFGFWNSDSNSTHGPTPGFYPIIISVALFGSSLIALIQSIGKDNLEASWSNWLVPAGLIAVIACSYIVGMYASILAYMLIWLKVYEKCSWKQTIVATVIIMALVIGAFGIWLGINFPKGLIGNLLF